MHLRCAAGTPVATLWAYRGPMGSATHCTEAPVGQSAPGSCAMDFGWTCKEGSKANNDADTTVRAAAAIRCTMSCAVSTLLSKDEGALMAAGHRRRRLQQVRRGRRQAEGSVDGGGVRHSGGIAGRWVAASIKGGPAVAINVCGNAGAGPPYRVGRDEVQLIRSLPFAVRVVATRPVAARVPKLGSPLRLLQSCRQLDIPSYQVITLIINQVLIIRIIITIYWLA